MEEVVAKAKIKKVGYIYGCVIDQVWGQYGWILAKFFFVKFSQGKKKKQTKNKANYQPSWSNVLGQLSVIIIVWEENFFSLGPN